MWLIGTIFLVITVVAALYGFGYLSSPFVGTFRIVFYFFFVFFLIALVVGVMQQPGYDPTAHGR